MKSKYFVAILGAIEIVLVLNNGMVQGKVANLAHVAGLISGFLFLKFWPYYWRRPIRESGGKRQKPKLQKKKA